jgi:hypothetical protein
MEKALRRKKLTAKDLAFVIERTCGRIPCGICGKITVHQGLSVGLELPHKEMKYGIDELCAECLTSTPKRLAELAREHAHMIEGKRPRRGDDTDSNISKAFDLRRMADILDTVPCIDEIDDGILARKIGEAFREEDDRRKARKAA